ncbi:MAG: nuclear transport factor 2 family protein [Sphaerochaetaceae bacterium]
MERLTEDRIRTLWSRTYNTQGKPDWSHLYPLYAENIRFQDSIQSLEGKDAFMAMCERLAGRCKQLDMDLYAITRGDTYAFLQWKMTMRFRFFPSSSIHGCSVLTIGEEEKIINQRDYYDLWGDIADHVPLYHRLYRWFMRTFFG